MRAPNGTAIVAIVFFVFGPVFALINQNASAIACLVMGWLFVALHRIRSER